ncbi:hypothetical protein VTK56DRAFT_2739 [Thermocarpiscus australiensis]
MSAKRAREEDAGSDAGTSPAPDDTRKPKKARHGFRVGPENLPDGPWKRKVTKIKKELITKAKVKKQYAKIKAEHQKKAAAATAVVHHSEAGEHESAAKPDHGTIDKPAPAPAPIHPERQAMLDASSRPPADDDDGHHHHNNNKKQAPEEEADATSSPSASPRQPRERRHPRKKQRPDYFSKELAAAERAKKEAEARAAEKARREQERQRRIAERERYRKAMAKAKAPGRDGKRKLGREGKLLLEKVKKLVGEN